MNEYIDDLYLLIDPELELNPRVVAEQAMLTTQKLQRIMLWSIKFPLAHTVPLSNTNTIVRFARPRWAASLAASYSHSGVGFVKKTATGRQRTVSSGAVNANSSGPNATRSTAIPEKTTDTTADTAGANGLHEPSAPPGDSAASSPDTMNTSTNQDIAVVVSSSSSCSGTDALTVTSDGPLITTSTNTNTIVNNDTNNDTIPTTSSSSSCPAVRKHTNMKTIKTETEFEEDCKKYSRKHTVLEHVVFEDIGTVEEFIDCYLSDDCDYALNT